MIRVNCSKVCTCNQRASHELNIIPEYVCLYYEVEIMSSYCEFSDIINGQMHGGKCSGERFLGRYQ